MKTLPMFLNGAWVESIDGGTRMTTVSTFIDEAQMEKMLAMGMREGMEQAVTQIDDVLASEMV